MRCRGRTRESCGFFQTAWWSPSPSLPASRRNARSCQRGRAPLNANLSLASTTMRAEKTSARCEGVRLSIERNGKEVARAYLFLMWNNLHQAPFGLLEDVYVDETVRGSGLGTETRTTHGFIDIYIL